MEDTSLIAAPSTLDIFSLPPTQYAILSNLVTEHRSISSVTSDSNISFVITTPRDEYINLKDLLLRLKLKVNLKKVDGGEPSLTDWNEVAPVNYLLNSLFKQVTIEINDKQITVSPQTYPYKAIFESTFGFTKDARTSFLSAAGYQEDSSTNPEVIDTIRNVLINPKHARGTGKIVELIGKPHLDIAFQERAILGGSKIKIEFVPHEPSFYLRADKTKVLPTVDFIDCSLFVHRAKVSQSIVDAHESALKKAPARYPFCRNEVKTFTINSGSLSANIDNIVNGQLPRRAFVAMVTNEAFNGTFDKNPFNFQHFKVNHICSHIDGIQFPSVAYTPNFEKGIYAREYIGFFEAVNQLTTDSTISLDMKKWATGNTIFAFNFAQDFANSCIQEGHNNPRKRGSMGLQIKFGAALTETINILIYLEFDNLIQIDSDRQTYTDFM